MISNDQLPPDGTIDGDGVWRGGKWHPNEPLTSNQDLVARLKHLEKYEWNSCSEDYGAQMTVAMGREVLAEIERLRARYEFLRDCVWQGKTIITRVDPDAHLRVQSVEEWEARLDAYLAERRPAAETKAEHQT
jgi:hypothetical protein